MDEMDNAARLAAYDEFAAGASAVCELGTVPNSQTLATPR